MKTLFTALSIVLLTVPTFATDTGDKTATEIAAMREEITALRSNIMSLNLKLADMQAMLRDMNSTVLKMRNEGLEAKNAAAQANAEGCEYRLNALKTKKDKLTSMGYRPEHPDVHTLEGQIAKLELECAKAADGKQAP